MCIRKSVPTVVTQSGVTQLQDESEHRGGRAVTHQQRSVSLGLTFHHRAAQELSVLSTESRDHFGQADPSSDRLDTPASQAWLPMQSLSSPFLSSLSFAFSGIQQK